MSVSDQKRAVGELMWMASEASRGEVFHAEHGTRLRRVAKILEALIEQQAAIRAALKEKN